MLYALTFLMSFTLMINAFPMTPVDDESVWDKRMILDDIIFPEGFDTRSGVIGNNYRWPNKALTYQLDSSFSASEKRIILNGMAKISSKTCITFRERTTEQDYVFIRRGGPDSGCNSAVGRVGGVQILNLQGPHNGPGGQSHCLHIGTIAHELIHALGFYHEQSRTDRDYYVTINWENITPGTSHNFNKFPNTMVDSLGVPYDYASIMHYDAYAFAIDYSVPTIIPANPVRSLGGQVLTNYDVQKLERMYKC